MMDHETRARVILKNLQREVHVAGIGLRHLTIEAGVDCKDDLDRVLQSLDANVAIVGDYLKRFHSIPA